jgi:hypothetical protein
MPIALSPRSSLLEMFGGQEFKEKNPRLGAILEGVLGGSDPAEAALDFAAPLAGGAVKIAKVIKRSKVSDKLLKIFGSPKDIRDTGFILEDGTLIDLKRSRSNQVASLRLTGKPSGWTDHGLAVEKAAGGARNRSTRLHPRNVEEYLEDSGAIRVNPTDKEIAFEALKKPNKAQVNQMRKMLDNKKVLMFEGPNRDFGHSPNPTKADLNKIITRMFKD